MRLYPDKLAGHLKKQLAPVYVISGDEPLQVQECADAVRAAARAAGYLGRELFVADADFDWQQLAASCDALSLFSEQRVLELKVPTGKVGKAGAEVLKAYAVRPADDAILLVNAGKFERSVLNSAWYKALDKLGVTLQIWPLKAQELPAWINTRLAAKGFRAEREAVSLLVERIEGNMLAAAQEIEKLSLIYEPGPLAAKDIIAAVANSARYSVFDLTEAALAGNAQRCLKVLQALEGEGLEPILAWHTLVTDLRSVVQVSQRLQGGAPLPQAMNDAKVWKMRQPLVSAAVKRMGYNAWLDVLRRADELDQLLKGRRPGQIWLELTELCLSVCGQPSALSSVARP